MQVELTALHWVYLTFICLIIGFMVMRRDTTLVCIVGICLLGLMAKGSIANSIMGIFDSFIYAITELLGTILVISIIVAMSKVLLRTGINEVMISPVTRFIQTPTLAYWITGILMMTISWFFWPSPAVALLGAVLLPVAVRAGYILLPFIVVTLLVVFLLLTPFYEIYRLAPWLGLGLGTALFAGAKIAGINFGVAAVAIVAPSFQNNRTMCQVALLGMGLSFILRTMVVFFYTMLFGVTVGREKMLPFFEMVRLVYLGRYVQRLESLFIILWVINGLLDLSFSLYFALYCIAYLGRLPTMRPLIPVVAILLSHIAMIPEDVVSAMMDYAVIGKTFFNVGIYAVPVLLVAALGWKKRKKVKQWAAG